MTLPFQNDFVDRCADIETYLKELKFINNLAIHKKIQLKGESYLGDNIVYEPTMESQQILRSNFYLLMYNMIEATAHNIIMALEDSINDEKVEFSKLQANIQELYVNGKIGELASLDKIKKRAYEITKTTSDDKIINIKLDINISGNVDFDYIEKISSQIRFKNRLTVVEKDIEAAMTRTVTARNTLAHGNKSFSEMGRQYDDVKELEQDYDIITKYLTSVLDNFANYLIEKRFLKK